jgi:hypothetical protein
MICKWLTRAGILQYLAAIVAVPSTAMLSWYYAEKQTHPICRFIFQEANIGDPAYTGEIGGRVGRRDKWGSQLEGKH